MTAVFVALCNGCATSDTDPSTANDPDQETMEWHEDEPTATAELAASTNYACVAACAAAYSTPCTTINHICATTTVITLGGTAIPCLYAKLAACAGSAAGAAVCINKLCQS